MIIYYLSFYNQFLIETIMINLWKKKNIFDSKAISLLKIVINLMIRYMIS